MDQAVSDTIDKDWIARAQSLQGMIADAADTTEAEGKVPAEVMEALHGAELFRMALPRSIGGGEASPLVLMQAVDCLLYTSPSPRDRG